MDPFEKIKIDDPSIQFDVIRGWDNPEDYISWVKEHAKQHPEMKELGYCDPDKIEEWFENLEGDGTVKIGAKFELVTKGETVLCLHPETFDPIRYEAVEGTYKRKGLILDYKDGKPLRWAMTPSVFGPESIGKSLGNPEE